MLEHLSRVARVVKTPGGNALLVGVGGSGRQSCSRLACFLADFDVFQPLGSKNGVDPSSPSSPSSPEGLFCVFFLLFFWFP